MRATETASRLASFERRGPGTDAERRAAGWLAKELGASGCRVQLESFWCRPNWAFAHAWHVALAVAGSLVAVSSPRVGGALLLASLVFVVTDALLGSSPGRRLTPECASQNVIARPRPTPGAAEMPVKLIVTANYDAGHTGLAYRALPRRTAARLSRATGHVSPGWLGWVAIAILALLGTAILRLEGHKGTAVGIVQLVATVGLIAAFALLIDITLSNPSPAAGDNAAGTAVAIALVKALEAAPPHSLAVELVLQGAGDGGGIGLRRYLGASGAGPWFAIRRGHRRPRGGDESSLRHSNAVVLGFAPCGSGRPQWWVSDGQLVALRYFGQLRRICAEIAQQEPYLGARPHHGRGATGALPARLARLPSVAIGCLDDDGVAPHSHQQSDIPATLDEHALDRALQFGLLIVDAIDAAVTLRQAANIATPA